MKATCKSGYAPLTINITFESELELELFTNLMNSAPRVAKAITDGAIADKLITMMSEIHLTLKRQRP